FSHNIIATQESQGLFPTVRANSRLSPVIINTWTSNLLMAMKLFYIIICLLLSTVAPALALEENLSRQVLSEMNLARSAPRTYAGYLRELRGRFRGKSYLLPGSGFRVTTIEGRGAVDEAIKYLSRQKPLPTLGWSDGLAAAAAELAEEQGRSGATGHVGRQSRGTKERIERHGRWERQIGENIGYGPRGARE